MKHTRVYVARHGETPWNEQKMIQGIADTDLSGKGRAQAQALKDKLAGEPLAAIYTSALKRTIATARPLAELLGVAIHSSERLNELNFGVLEGSVTTRLGEEYQKIWDCFSNDPVGCPIPQGERYTDLFKRVSHVCDEALEKCAGKEFLFVAHKQVNRAILARLTSFPLQNAMMIQQENDILYRIDIGVEIEASWSSLSGADGGWNPLELPFNTN